MLFTYWQPMQIAFDTAAIGLEEWLLISVVSFSIYSIIGLEKLIFRQFIR
jgi:hypothetical protein